MKPVATIVGSNGQDGQLLKKKLKSIGYSIVGITSDTMDITNSKEVSDLIPSAKPKEVYSLAAFHHSSEEDINKDLKLFSKSIDIHVIATVNFLDEITFHSPKSRFFLCIVLPSFRSIRYLANRRYRNKTEGNLWHIQGSHYIYLFNFW